METHVPSRTGEVNDKQLASNELIHLAPDQVVWVRVLAGDISSGYTHLGFGVFRRVNGLGLV